MATSTPQYTTGPVTSKWSGVAGLTRTPSSWTGIAGLKRLAGPTQTTVTPPPDPAGMTTLGATITPHPSDPTLGWGDTEAYQGFDPSQIQNDPAYQYQLGQANRASDQGMAARGMFHSGDALQALQENAAGLTGQYMNDYYNRFANERGYRQGERQRLFGNTMADLQNQWGMGMGMSRLGMGALDQESDLERLLTEGNAGDLTGIGNAQGAADVSSANQWGQALSGFGNDLNDQITLGRLLKPPPK